MLLPNHRLSFTVLAALCYFGIFYLSFYQSLALLTASTSELYGLSSVNVLDEISNTTVPSFAPSISLPTLEPSSEPTEQQEEPILAPSISPPTLEPSSEPTEQQEVPSAAPADEATTSPSFSPSTFSSFVPSTNSIIGVTVSPSINTNNSNYTCLNVLDFKNIVYSASSVSESHLPRSAFDTDLNTFWQSDTVSFPDWIQISLPFDYAPDAYRIASIAMDPRLKGQEISTWEFQGYDKKDGLWITIDRQDNIQPKNDINQYNILKPGANFNQSFLRNPLFPAFRWLIYDNCGWREDSERHQAKVIINFIELCQLTANTENNSAEELAAKSIETKKALLRLTVLLFAVIVVVFGWIYWKRWKNNVGTRGSSQRNRDGAVYSSVTAIHDDREEGLGDEEEHRRLTHIIGDEDDENDGDITTIELTRR